MKKVLVLCMAAIMVLSLSVMAFAADGGFVSSPTAQPAPDLEGAKNEDGENVKLVLTPYSGHDGLPTELNQEMQAAYDDIAENKDVTKLSKDLGPAATAAGVDPANLAVSDLFDLHFTDEENHGTVTVTLKSESFKNFVALLHYTGSAWEVVKDAKVDGTTLTFSTGSFSPFAVVVSTTTQRPPQTGDTMVVGICAAIMTVSAIGMAVAFKKSKKSV